MMGTGRLPRVPCILLAELWPNSLCCDTLSTAEPSCLPNKRQSIPAVSICNEPQIPKRREHESIPTDREIWSAQQALGTKHAAAKENSRKLTTEKYVIWAKLLVKLKVSSSTKSSEVLHIEENTVKHRLAGLLCRPLPQLLPQASRVLLQKIHQLRLTSSTKSKRQDVKKYRAPLAFPRSTKKYQSTLSFTLNGPVFERSPLFVLEEINYFRYLQEGPSQ